MAALHSWMVADGAVWFGVWFFKFLGEMGAGVFLRWWPVVLCFGGLLAALLVGPLAALLYGLFFIFMNKHYFLF